MSTKSMTKPCPGEHDCEVVGGIDGEVYLECIECGTRFAVKLADLGLNGSEPKMALRSDA